MPKPLNSNKIVDIPLKNWKDIGDFIGNEVRELVRDKKVLGGSYSSDYRISKSSGTASPRGVPQASTSSKVDLTLTGKMLDDLKRDRVSKNQVTLSLLTINKKKMNSNMKKGWDMLDNNKVLKPIKSSINKRLESQINKNINNWEKGKIVINLNK